MQIISCAVHAYVRQYIRPAHYSPMMVAQPGRTPCSLSRTTSTTTHPILHSFDRGFCCIVLIKL